MVYSTKELPRTSIISFMQVDYHYGCMLIAATGSGGRSEDVGPLNCGRRCPFAMVGWPQEA